MKELVNKFDARLSQIVARAPRVLKTSGPIVSFTFDDIPASALRGADLLESVGARGTFYIAAGMLGTAGTSGRHADQQEVSELSGRGHEIGCHTYSHARAASCSKSGFAAELDRNRDFLADVVGVVPKSFAFPFGSVSTSTKYAARARYSSCRTTRSLVQTTNFDAAGLGGFPVLFQSRASPCLRRSHRKERRRKELGNFLHARRGAGSVCIRLSARQSPVFDLALQITCIHIFNCWRCNR